MSLDLPLILELALLGLGSGFLAGLLGIGGGMVMVPFLTWIMDQRGVPTDLAVKMAIATSMGTILFTSLSSLRAHHKRGAVLWPIVWRLAPGIVGGGLLGSLGVFSYLPGDWLAIVFALFIGFLATQMFRNKKPASGRKMPGHGGQFAVGMVIGFASGLVGAGGGFLSIPFMTWANVAIHNAVATSAALGFPIALANVAGYVGAGLSATDLPEGAFGYLWLPALGVIAVCSVLMAPLGAKAAHSLPVQKLKRAFASVLYLLAVYMLWQGLSR